MMDGGGMGTMMTWMMGIGMLGWVLVIALLFTVVFVLVRFLTERSGGALRDRPEQRDRLKPPS